MDEWVVNYLPAENRFCSGIKETIRYMDQRANRDQQPMEKENSGATENQLFVIDWFEQDGTQNMLTKVKYTGSMDATLSERFQTVTEAVCSVATTVWHVQYGHKSIVSKIQNIECYCDLTREDEFFILFERLSASHKAYRGDATLLDRAGRCLARWEEVCGERNFN